MQDAAIIDALRALSHKGMLDPAVVVDAARDVTSPLHDRFTWDDSDAAHQFRLIEARKLIQVCIEYLPQRSDPSPVWVSLRADRPKGGGYRPMVAVMSQEETRRMLLADALADLEYFKKKYGMLEELAGVFAAMRKIKK